MSKNRLDADRPLKGRVALVTGASRGIGAAAAKALSRAGAQVVLTARTVGGLEETDDAIKAEGGKATLAPLDLSKLDQIDILGASLYQRFEKIDIFVGAAATLGPMTPMSDVSPKDWSAVFTLNVHANQRLIRTLDPMLKRSEAGRIILVTSSSAASGAQPFTAAYGASKAALESLAKTYASETKTTNLRVNLINPGPVATRLRAKAYPGEDQTTLPTPDDISPLFVSLASPLCTKHGEIVSFFPDSTASP